jgi:hypothetical protein
MLRRVTLVSTDVSEELVTSIIRVTRIGVLGTLANGWRRYVPPKRLFLQAPHGVTSHKTAFFIVTAVKTSDLTSSAMSATSALQDIFLILEKTKNLGG